MINTPVIGKDPLTLTGDGRRSSEHTRHGDRKICPGKLQADARSEIPSIRA
jgi:hypothetical protein